MSASHHSHHHLHATGVAHTHGAAARQSDHIHREGDPEPGITELGGVTRVELPIGVNAIESVNMYILADGDKVTVVDCGVWRPDLPGRRPGRRGGAAWRAPGTPCGTSPG